MSRSNQLPNLEKIFKDDDEQDFNPVGGSNLASIFGTSNKSLDNVTKTPSKKSKNDKTKVQSSPSSTSSKTDVILAKVIHAYKLQNGQYSPLGKLGIALTGNTSTKTYLLILYRHKNEHISVVTLTADFNLSIQENNYVSYYDGNNDNWSILFDSNDSCIEFAREIAVSKYLMRQGKTEESIYFENLTICTEKDTKEAKEGDSINIKCSIITNIIQPLKVSSIPVQNMTVQISSDDNWERSLLGISPGCKRILILSPSKQISLGPGFPRDKEVALDIEVVDIIPEVKPIASPKPPTGKASLISRMAKMGQSILPKVPTSTTTDSEDTEEDVPIKSPRRAKVSDNGVKSSAVPKNLTSDSSQDNIPDGNVKCTVRNSNSTAVSTPHGSLVPAAFTSGWSTPVPQQFISTIDGQLYSIPSSVSQSPVAGSLDPNINVFLSETRTQNAEIRMGMSKISDNVQKLLDKFHALELQNATASPSNDKALETSLKMLLALNLNKNDPKVSEGNNNSTCAELNEARERIRFLEDELKSLKNHSTESFNKLEYFEKEKKELVSEKEEMKNTIKELESKLMEARSELQKAQENIKSTNEQVIKYQRDNIKMEQKIMTLEAEQRSLKSRNLTSDNKAAETKSLMNKMYQTLMTKFTDDSYSNDYIKSTIASTIKAITLQVLREKNDVELRSSNVEYSDPPDSHKIKDLKSSEDSFILPALDTMSDSKDIDTASVLSEPPPIPPMDLDDDWLP
ncbi:FK506-binding protein 15 [Cotesia glomerata]|uniref:FK506-binding protein 15 n=1 Tax=Cotesia glomerata TaxID=32391 RepID=A0AAV7J3K2_COTGL|nr:FK506-binding protein 15 [Cotesia glomerata]KAH0564530.1 hypothetical protein KQX54_012611 [Cotesia glomerata]